MSRLFVPVDLYRPIIEYVSEKRDLSALCAVSKSFQLEAERPLYREARLTGHAACLFSFSHAILSNSRLGPLVISLTMPSRTESGADCALLAVLMSRTLKSLSNLNALFIANSHFLIAQPFLRPIDLLGSHFHLDTFGLRSGSLSLSALVPFLLTQPEITYLKYDHRTQEGGDAFTHHVDLLPRLSRLCLCVWQILPYFHRRPIARLCLKNIALSLDAFPKMVAVLAIFSKTLTHLSLELSEEGFFATASYPMPCLVMLLSRIQENLPQLKFLRLSGEVVLVCSPPARDAVRNTNLPRRISGTKISRRFSIVYQKCRHSRHL